MNTHSDVEGKVSVVMNGLGEINEQVKYWGLDVDTAHQQGREIVRQALTEMKEAGAREERERIILLQDQIQDEAICPADENCPLCLRGLRRKCNSAEYRGMSEALEAIQTLNPTNKDI